MLADSLIFPALALFCLGWVVPRLLAAFWPEGVKPLILLGLVSALILFFVAAGVFMALYVLGGVPFAALINLGFAAFALHFARLGLVSALFWGPMLLLSVAGLPKYWVRENW
ncbi:MAG: hypothetical protein H3C51_05500 [Rubellimicrobium sp.]|nr:hypothetical protein [Rubellimicrobium sp.]